MMRDWRQDGVGAAREATTSGRADGGDGDYDPSRIADIASVCRASEVPLLFAGAALDQPCCRQPWDPAYLKDAFGSARAAVMVQEATHAEGPTEARAGFPERESQCPVVRASLEEFATWVSTGQVAEASELSKYAEARPWSPADPQGGRGRRYRGYVSYSRFPDLFRDEDHRSRARECVDWSRFGVPSSISDTTFWWGSPLAATHMHYDSYGINFVVQVHGTKRWLLCPPSCSAAIEPTRVPYEESSVFSYLAAGERRSCVGEVEFVLRRGDLLYVPRHWWHAVTCLDQAVSVNAWVPHDLDARERVREAVAKFAVFTALSPPGEQGEMTEWEPNPWINPSEGGLADPNKLWVCARLLHRALEEHRLVGLGVVHDIGSFDLEWGDLQPLLARAVSMPAANHIMAEGIVSAWEKLRGSSCHLLQEGTRGQGRRGLQACVQRATGIVDSAVGEMLRQAVEDMSSLDEAGREGIFAADASKHYWDGARAVCAALGAGAPEEAVEKSHNTLREALAHGFGQPKAVELIAEELLLGWRSVEGTPPNKRKRAS